MVLPIALTMHLPLDQIPTNTYNGWRCWLGESSVFPGDPSGMPPDHCGTAPLYVSMYILFNVIYNILIIVVIKYGSANLLFMASTIMVPIGNVAFSFKFVPGHQPLKTNDILGLVFIMLGLVLYRFYSEVEKAWITYRTPPSVVEEDKKRRSKKIERVASRRQLSYMGLSQAEYLQGLIDTRIVNEERDRLFRSPQQVRGNLLMRLGIPPSPQIAINPRSPAAGPTAAVRHQTIQLTDSPPSSLNSESGSVKGRAGYKKLRAQQQGNGARRQGYGATPESPV